MAMEYFIVELQGSGKVQHGSTFNHTEAHRKADQIRNRTGNAVTVQAEFISSNQIEDDSTGFFQFPLTAEEIFRQAQGADADYDSQPYAIKRAYEVCAAAGNNAIGEYISGIMHFTDISEGLKS